MEPGKRSFPIATGGMGDGGEGDEREGLIFHRSFRERMEL